MTKFIPKGVSFVFFCTKAKKNGIIEAEKGDENVKRNKGSTVKI